MNPVVDGSVICAQRAQATSEAPSELKVENSKDLNDARNNHTVRCKNPAGASSKATECQVPPPPLAEVQRRHHYH